MKRLIQWLAITACMAAGAPCFAQVTYYAIGNSLTNDMYPSQVPALASQKGRQLTVGYHVRGGLSLDYIVANPQDPTITQGGSFDQALVSGTWNSVSIQPYFGTNSTLASDLSAIQQFVTLTRSGPSRDAVIYLYAAWPSQYETQGDYSGFWRKPVVDSPATKTVATRAYFDALLARLVAAHGGSVTFRVIPVGDVLARLDVEARAGRLPGVRSLADLYRDDVHMGEVGRFVAATTVFATLFRESPAGISVPASYQFGDGAARLSPALTSTLESLVWEVVSTDPRTGAMTSSPASNQATAAPPMPVPAPVAVPAPAPAPVAAPSPSPTPSPAPAAAPPTSTSPAEGAAIAPVQSSPAAPTSAVAGTLTNGLPESAGGGGGSIGGGLLPCLLAAAVARMRRRRIETAADGRDQGREQRQVAA
jgi:hypothetical protein